MAAYNTPYSNQDDYFDGYGPTRSTSLSSYFSPTTFPNQSPAVGRLTSRGYNSVSDYLNPTLGTGGNYNYSPTVATGIPSLDERLGMANSMSKAQYGDNPPNLTNTQVLGNQLKNSWSELGLGGQINAAANTIGGLYQAYTGGREVKLAKAQMRFNKDAWNKEYANAVQDVNRSLRDRQQLRNYYNPDMYGNPDDYVAKYGAK